MEYKGNEVMNIYIASHFPGRTRFKISKLYKNHELSKNLIDAFANLNYIHGIKINIYTKSLILTYNNSYVGVKDIIKKLKNFMVLYNNACREKNECLKCTATTSQSKAKNLSKKHVISNKKSLTKKAYNHPIKHVSSRSDKINSDKWYQMNIESILKKLNTDIKFGLSTKNADARLKIIGLNEFEQKKKKSIISMFLDEFKGFLIKLLLGASVISAFLGQIGDSIAILTIVIVEAALGVWQNYKAEKSLEELKKYSSSTSKAIRDGKLKLIKSKLLVPGDIISFEAGDIIPADARIIYSSGLKISESSLTGESEAIEKSYKIEYTSSVPLADRKNMVFMGTTVVKGTGKAVVVQTGMDTEIGNIAKLIGKSNTQLTPLQKDLDNLAKSITWTCLGICGAIMFAGILGGQPLFQMFRTGVSLAIGAVPEGLTTVLTISLAFGVQRMAKKGAIVKKLPSVETLSCADVICTDKTGTLTAGQMTVTDVTTINKEYKIAGEGYSTEGDFFYENHIIDPSSKFILHKLITIGALCNNSSYTKNKDNSLEILGDPTEGALLVLAAKANIDLKEFDCYTRVKEIAFNSEMKKMTVICKDSVGDHTVNMKGAPDVILSKCTKIIDGDKTRPITAEDKKAIKRKINHMANRALRVIGFAYKNISNEEIDNEKVENDMIFVGLVGMIDPPRPEVKSAIKKCKRAGVRTIMITGDHKKTAKAIGNQIGLLDKNKIIVTGEELDKLSDKELLKTIDNIAIFARTSPHQKLRIVKALKQKGHIVAMTGDGVNDAPAIKESNIGIAMGQNGTDVTRESSSIILTNDNFITIVNAIEEGRTTSCNIKKFMKYVLSGNVGEVLAIFIATLLRMPVPLIPIQILMINLITEGIPALSLGIEPPDKDIMKNPPRKGDESIFSKKLLGKILSRGFMMGISTLGIFTATYYATGNIIKARTLAYTNLVTNQMFHVFDCRTARLSENRCVISSVAISSMILLSTVYIPSLVSLFGTCPLGINDWLIILFMSGFIGRLDYLKQKASTIYKRKTLQPAY